MTTTGPQLHEQVEPLAFLLGTWQGTGVGAYPTIETFGYVEEISFGHVGKPFLAYGQKTRHADTGAPLHAESGYWRVVGPGRLEVVMVHPTGILESLRGSFATADGVTTFDLRCDEIQLTETAVSVTATERLITVEGDTLSYDLSMAAVGRPMTHHLNATLHRA